ncbi:MAG TPA: type VI secretion system baseplate subunit TssF [Herpetosiphonaceae bacterium]
MSGHREDNLLKYYLRELAYLRAMGAQFAEQHPAVAGRLDLGEHQGSDPHVERLLESFALLTGRIQHQIDSEFPEIPSALLEVLYPQLQAPIPSMSIAQFEVEPSQGQLTTGFTIAPQTPLFATTHDGQTCWFRTCYPLTLWPLEVIDAALSLAAPGGPALRLRLAAGPGVDLAALSLDRLRFHLRGNQQLVAGLCDLLFGYADAVYLVPASDRTMPVDDRYLSASSRLPSGALRPVGFGADEAVLPYPGHAHPAYRLLQEYFAFPKKFHFFEIGGIDLTTLSIAPGTSPTVFDLVITCRNETRAELAGLEQVRDLVRAETFSLGCTPVINLFPQTLEPVRLDHTRTEYPLIPDVQRQSTIEVHSIERVVAVSERGTEMKTLAPLYGLDHTMQRRNQKAFWHARRLPYRHQGLPGTEMTLAFTDLMFNPQAPAAQTVYVHALCTNRSLAEHLLPGTRLQFEQAAPLRRITCLDRPTPPITPPLRGATLWRLVSQLSLNHLSLIDPVQFSVPRHHRADLNTRQFSPELRAIFQDHGLRLSPNVLVSDQATGETETARIWTIQDQAHGKTYLIVDEAQQLAVTTNAGALHALREILKLYSVADDPVRHRQIQGIVDLACRRVMQRVGTDGWGGFGRGIEITLTFDQTLYQHESALLLAAVLNHFFSLYVGANLFTRLVARRKDSKGIWKRWQPLAGGQIVL